MKDHPVITALAIVASVFGLFVLSVVVLVHLVAGGDEAAPSGPHVGIIEISGPIVEAKPVIDKIIEMRKDTEVKAIVMRIDSPGGEVGPSQEIHEEVRKATKVKPVVASMGGVAASGGYYIAAGCSRIVANPGTITGSIGVLIEFANVEGLLHKLGVQADVVKSGTFKDTGSPFRPMTPKERALIQGVINSVYDQFVKVVAEGRKMPVDKVRAIADGRILSGEQAHQYGLVDSLGNLEDATEMAGRLGGIKGEVETAYVKKPFSLWKLLLGDDSSSSSSTFFQHLTSHYRALYVMPGTLTH